MPCHFFISPTRHFEHPPLDCRFEWPEESALIALNGKLWCPFHFPLRDDAGNPTEKASWEPQKLHEFEDKVHHLIKEAWERNRIGDFSGVVFPIKLNLSGNKKLPSLYFDNATFCHNSYFEKATFRNDTSFVNATFFGQASFEHTTFLKNATFWKAAFHKDASFKEMSFQGNANFRNATFRGDVLFERTNFNFDALWDETNFYKFASLDEVNFIRGAHFNNSKFHEDASFNGAKFHSDSWFKNTTFQGDAFFLEATFQGDTSFGWATFQKKTSFWKATFQKETSFFNATFKGEASFLSTGDLPGEEKLKSNVFPHANFSNVKFESYISFVNRRFLQPANFSGCIFHKAPEFHGCSLHQGAVFPPRTNFKDVSSEDAAQAYRTLKLAMEQVRARQEEAMFYALEQQSLRAKATTPLSIKTLSYLYQVTANYGESFLRPLGWLGATTLISFLMYVAIGYYLTGEAFSLLGGLQFTLEQLVRPFSAWLPSGGVSIKEYFGSNPSLLLLFQFLATLQSVFSLSFLTLFILAVRRRFKLS